MCSHVAAFHTVNRENKKSKLQACFVVLVIKVELRNPVQIQIRFPLVFCARWAVLVRCILKRGPVR